MNASPSTAPVAARASAGGRFAFADAVRGLAALWVVLFHLSAGLHIEQLKALMPDWLRTSLFEHGHLGVAAFFVLSGFVMALNVQGARTDAAFAARFMARRFVRLTPPYYFSILLCLAYLVLQAVTLQEPINLPGPATLLAHAFYLQDLFAVPSISGVYWTLCIEVQFYLVFALLVLLAERARTGLGGRGVSASLGFASAVVALLWPLGVITHPLWPGGFVPYWYSFAAGMLICLGWKEKGASLKMALVYCAALLIIAARTGDGFAVVASGTAVLLLTAALANRMNLWLNFRWTQFLGTVSYSLYLIHNDFIGGCFFLVRRFLPGSALGELVGAVFTLAALLFASWLVYRLVERPCIEWSRRISFRSRAAVGTPPPAIC